VESLQQREPKIFVNDPLWSSNKRLVKYEIQSDQASGQSWRCEVLLTVQDGPGSPKQNQASYTVDTDPALVVVRD
jgi:hypothetical protein